MSPIIAVAITAPAAARDLSRRMGLGLQVDPRHVAESLSVHVALLPLSDKLSGTLIYEGDGLWVAFVNARFGSEERRRFTIAHELGHFMLHREQVKVTGTSARLTREQEAEADAFAAELLMPEPWVRMLHPYHPTPERSFGVSRTAWRRRLAELGLDKPQPVDWRAAAKAIHW